jgi:1-acyl-sn-glycerol-3-phosphate acyltransferase
VVRPLASVPLLGLVTLGFGVPAVLVGLADRTGRLPLRIARLWARALLWIVGVRVSVSGLANVPSGPAVYAANHGSILDIPILFGHLPVNFRIVHKRSIYLIPVVGWFLYLAGHIGVDRRNAFRARRSLGAAAERIRRGTSVAVFPEGTRSRDGSVRRFKRGSFVLAQQAGVPVVPVSLAGVKALIPRGLPTLRPGRIELRIHEPIPTAGASVEAAERLAEDARAIVIAGCEAAEGVG